MGHVDPTSTAVYLTITAGLLRQANRRFEAFVEPVWAEDDPRTGRTVGPRIFRHTAAVHLLEAGVEVNVIRAWLGHADLSTTNRYAEINTKTKLAALRATEPPGSSGASHTKPIWRTDESFLNRLASL